MSSQARRLPSFVGDHDAPKVVGEASLQAARDLAWCLSFGDLGSVVEVAAAARHADLGDCNGVKGGVELPIPVW
jgi:hypothetical protein